MPRCWRTVLRLASPSWHLRAATWKPAPSGPPGAGAQPSCRSQGLPSAIVAYWTGRRDQDEHRRRASVQVVALGGTSAGRALWPEYSVCYRSFSSVGSTGAPSMSGFYELRLAQTGEGIAECELLRWHVKEGDDVEQFQPVCEVQSDKASVEVTSRYKGKIAHLRFAPGDVVKCDAVVSSHKLATIDDATACQTCLLGIVQQVGETLLDLLPVGATSPKSLLETDRSQPLVKECPQPPQKTGPSGPQKLSSGYESDLEDKRPRADDVPASESPPAAQKSQTLATPAVRHLARVYRAHLPEVIGTGKDGRILREDVLQYAAAKQAAEQERPDRESSSRSPQQGSPSESTEQSLVIDNREEATPASHVIHIRGYRRAMAKTMQAANKIPHFTFMEDLEMDQLSLLRDSLLEMASAQGLKLTYLPFIVKALSKSLERFPILNGTLSEDMTEIMCKASHNVGIAMAVEGGLVVPNVKNCQQLSVLKIGLEIQRLQKLAAYNKLPAADLEEGTITISNVGTIGGTYAVPVIKVPELAIVALGKIQKVPRFDKDEDLYSASIMPVSWSADHRVIDGATLALFCQEWKRNIEQPGRLLLSSR
eukprot:SM000217S06863  [mRNA]  locus=s217:144255:146986:- [translate_table: standard]